MRERGPTANLTGRATHTRESHCGVNVYAQHLPKPQLNPQLAASGGGLPLVGTSRTGEICQPFCQHAAHPDHYPGINLPIALRLGIVHAAAASSPGLVSVQVS